MPQNKSLKVASLGLGLRPRVELELELRVGVGLRLRLRGSGRVLVAGMEPSLAVGVVTGIFNSLTACQKKNEQMFCKNLFAGV